MFFFLLTGAKAMMRNGLLREPTNGARLARVGTNFQQKIMRAVRGIIRLEEE